MKKSYKLLITENNEKLKTHKQNLTIVVWSEGVLELSTSVTLTGKDIRKFRHHINSPMLVGNMDKLYSNSSVNRTLMVKEIQRQYASCKNKEWWNKLDPAVAEIKREHMRSVQKLVDYSTIKKTNVWNKGKTKDTDLRLAKNSADRLGSKNPMYGTKWSQKQKQEKSMWVKNRIMTGKWTPHVHNSRTHWNCSYNGKQYRSSWEAMYASLNDDEYEIIRIPYIINGEHKIYIVDFCNHTTKTLTEIKPIAHTSTLIFNAKVDAALRWCTEHSYQFRILTEQYFVDNFEKLPFEKLTVPNIREKLAKIKYEANQQN